MSTIITFDALFVNTALTHHISPSARLSGLKVAAASAPLCCVCRLVLCSIRVAATAMRPVLQACIRAVEGCRLQTEHVEGITDKTTTSFGVSWVGRGSGLRAPAMQASMPHLSSQCAR